MTAIALNQASHDPITVPGRPAAPAAGLARVVDALPAAVVVLDAAGTVAEVNASAARLLDGRLTGRAWSEIARRAFDPAGGRGGELRLRDGRWLTLSRRPLDGGGEVLLLTDVSGNRRLSELLDRRDRLAAIGEMTARLAHQIRTPLSSALLYASQLETAAGEGAPAARLKRRLEDLGHLIDDMLSFARGARHAQQTVTVGALLEEVADAFAPGAGREAIDVVLLEPSMTIEGDRESIRGALVNLVENAIQAGGSPPRVELGAERCKGRICLTVADSGPGIPPEAAGRLFEPFFTTRPQGTGLGLAIVQTVAEAHGGEVLVDSRPAGTTFALCLPVAGAPR